MSYQTVDVLIEDGRILTQSGVALPQNGAGVLILFPKESLLPAVDFSAAIAESWAKLGPAPEIDHDKL